MAPDVPHHPIIEDTEEALTEGDDYVRGVGTTRSALAHREFRLMWLGSFASNIGTWMQTVVLGSYAYKLTESSVFVGALAFAQLGPLLLLSVVGGMVADALDRRKLLIVLQTEQLVFSLALAAIVAGSDDPSRVLIFGCVLAVGIGNALNAPVWGAVVPSLVGQEDLGAAIALNSTMINGSRVIGPAIAGILYPIFGAAWMFTANAVTYLFVILALLVVRFPAVPRSRRAGLATAHGRLPGRPRERDRRAASSSPSPSSRSSRCRSSRSSRRSPKRTSGCRRTASATASCTPCSGWAPAPGRCRSAPSWPTP